MIPLKDSNKVPVCIEVHGCVSLSLPGLGDTKTLKQHSMFGTWGAVCVGGCLVAFTRCRESRDACEKLVRVSKNYCLGQVGLGGAANSIFCLS